MKYPKTILATLVGLTCLATLLFVDLQGLQPDPSSMAHSLPKLTSTVLGELRDPLSGKPPPDDQLVSEAMKTNAEFAREFPKVVFKVLHNTTNLVLMVCSPDGKRAWLEDASWTQFLDNKPYLSNPPAPAEFTINLP